MNTGKCCLQQIQLVVVWRHCMCVIKVVHSSIIAAGPHGRRPGRGTSVVLKHATQFEHFYPFYHKIQITQVLLWSVTGVAQVRCFVTNNYTVFCCECCFVADGLCQNVNFCCDLLCGTCVVSLTKFCVCKSMCKLLHCYL